jgi:hypothetical protein
MSAVSTGVPSEQNLLSIVTGPQLLTCVVLLVVLFFYFIKRNFNTWSIFTAYSAVRENDAVRKRYMQLFESRENLLFHIGSAKSHGETDLARRLLRELDTVDKEIDSMEEKYSNLLKK